ncbi:hypothetical protein B4902_08510 [Yersinia frederiksenii]|uniref:hypothetical protein n=1 Tax=Yersinia frederiksenii TaxID=29484 RepID=UPI000B754143|nr:hypothetical protein [Yersinia frederiksenii]OWF73311.1 hypothetical protein B4902_08510 [Yersinia frederiksenii]
MATHINTTNAIKGLTCAIECFKTFGFNQFTSHAIKHLTDAATEIDRLNNEAIKLRSEIVRLKAVSPSSFSSLWEKLIDAVSTTAAGEFVSSPGVFDCALETERAIAAINKTEADRRKALRIAEAFQKAQSEPTDDIFDAFRRTLFTDYFPAPYVLNMSLARRPGKATRINYQDITGEIIHEAVRAADIHPKWPTDVVHAVSILTEESGELMKAAIEYHYNNGDIEAVREEAIQTGAMALRVLLNIDKYKRPSDEK